MKILEEKDLVEISISNEILKDDDVLELIIFLYDKEVENNEFCTTFPLSLYKLLVYYDKLSIFETLITFEKKNQT